MFNLVLLFVTKTVLLLCKHVQLGGQKWWIVSGEGTLTAQPFHTVANAQQNTTYTQRTETRVFSVRRWLCGKCRS